MSENYFVKAADKIRDILKSLDWRLENEIKTVSTPNNAEAKTENGYELHSINFYGNIPYEQARIEVYMLDNAIGKGEYNEEGFPLVRNGDMATFYAEYRKDIKFWAITTEEEKAQAAEHRTAMSESLDKMGKVYICGTDPEHAIYAVTLRNDFSEERDDVTVHRYQRQGKFDIGEKTYTFKDFCKYYRLADEEEAKRFNKNIERDKGNEKE